MKKLILIAIITLCFGFAAEGGNPPGTVPVKHTIVIPPHLKKIIAHPIGPEKQPPRTTTSVKTSSSHK